MELNNAETQAYTSQGHEFITRLAGKIQDSSPGVRGNSSPYGDRSATRIDRQQVDEVTIAWIKERRNAL
jgi:hypothetical protein